MPKWAARRPSPAPSRHRLPPLTKLRHRRPPRKLQPPNSAKAKNWAKAIGRRPGARRQGAALAPAARPPRLPPRPMKNRSGIQGVASSPVIVGAVTVLVLIVAVFLAYNANNGLPFVSTYNLTARVPNADAIVKGNEVRIGGARVGIVRSVSPVQLENGEVVAELDLRLDKTAEPVPVNSTMIIRPKSPLGLKYLQIVPGESDEGFEAGDTIPVSRGASGTGRHRRVLQHLRRADPQLDPAQPDRLRQRLRRPWAADQQRLRRPAQPRRKQPGAAAHDRRPEHRLRRLLAGSRGPLRHRRPGGRDPGQHVRRPRSHLRRLRPRLSPLHPGNDREEPADPRSGDRRPAGDPPLLPQLRALLHGVAARRARRRPHLADDQQRRCGPASRSSTPRRPSTPSCRRPRKRCSTSRKPPASSTASTC